jgi:hypothetical protein
VLSVDPFLLKSYRCIKPILLNDQEHFQTMALVLVAGNYKWLNYLMLLRKQQEAQKMKKMFEVKVSVKGVPAK